MKIMIAVPDHSKLKKSFENFRKALDNNPETKAAFYAACASLSTFAKDFTIYPKSMVEGNLRTSMKIDRKDINFGKLNIESRAIEKALFGIGRKAIPQKVKTEDTISNGQGIVFRSIVLWYLPGRNMRDAWADPGMQQDSYLIRWFPGKTAKSTKAPVRFKGWKGGR